MHDPAFWDDPDAAQAVSSQYSRLKNRLDDYAELTGQVDDLELMLELIAEEGNAGDAPADLLKDMEQVARNASRTLDRFEEQRLFSGEFDAGDAVVSIHPGAGGTESQDWAEMLL
ncbi:MAG: PCRF domain-containing protein, partial [Dehalococcoidia bacterium]|nr:PCRF domain-containing protein [Dehalococcoidia bacterium]